MGKNINNNKGTNKRNCVGVYIQNCDTAVEQTPQFHKYEDCCCVVPYPDTLPVYCYSVVQL
jgi:hypothetical protein